MPWIDREALTEVAERLRTEHGITGVEIGRIHVDPGPEATRESIIDNLVFSIANIERRRRDGTLKNEPPLTNKPKVNVHDWLRDKGL